MAISADYVVRETFTNLRRNLLMTAAAVLTVMVSLSLVGGILLLKQGVSRATLRWRGGVELSVFMNPDVAKTQRDAIEAELRAMPEVKKITYVDQYASYEEFKQMFANSPDMVDSVSAKDLPPSYRVVPRQPEFAETIGGRFQKREGVKEVSYAQQAVKAILRVTTIAQRFFFAVAALLLVSAALLILNSIRMAIFARRREVAVMKLVGATNWFIRVPFMLEGMIQGLLGAGASFLLVSLGRGLLTGAMRRNSLLSQFVVSGSDVLGTGIFILTLGAFVGAIGSAIAVSRFLDV